MYYLLISIYAWLIVLLSFFTLFPIAVITWLFTVLFDKRLTWLHQFSSFWASTFIWLNPLWKVKIINREKIDTQTAYVMVCNHQSMLDIIVLYRLFTHFKWVSKKELFRVPFVGWNMSLNRYIEVDRGNKASHLQMMKDCENHLQQGSSIMIFPEGTRSKDGEFLAFKEGAFKIALATKVSILPIVLDGSSDLLPRHGFILKNKETIKVKVLDPIPYSTFQNVSPKELSQQVRDIMLDEFQKLRQAKA
jgi:1-acyl-sn-glycerol-3-phosphate acyltransferase